MKKALLFLFLLFSLHCSAQKYRDSLKSVIQKDVLADTLKVKVLTDLCYEYLLIDLDSSVQFGRQSVALSRLIDFKKGLAQSLSDLGVALFYKAALSEAILVWEEALSIRKELGDESGSAALAVKLGAVYFKQGNFSKSLESQTQALKSFEKLNNSVGQASALNNIAAVFEHQQEFSKALEYHKKSMRLAESINDSVQKGTSILNIGNIFYRMQAYDSAKRYWLRSLVFLKEEKSPQYCAMAYNNLSELYTILNKYDSASSMANKAINLRLRLGDYQGYVSSLNNLGNIQLKTGRFKSAETLFLTAMDSLKKHPLKIEEQKVLGNLATLYEQSGNYKDALAYFKDYVAIKDTLLNENSRKNTNDLLIQYETEKKEQQIALQHAQLSEQEAQLQQTYLVITALIIIVALVIVIFFLIRNRFKRKQQLAENEKQLAVREAFIDATIQSQEKERKRVAQDLHDGMGQLISALRMTVSKLTPNAVQQERHAIVEQSEKILNDMHREVRGVAFNLMPQTLIQYGLLPALHEMALRIDESGKIRMRIISFEMPERLSEVQEISLYRIVQEWTNNVMKYAMATMIEVNLVAGEHDFSITIEDNGNGFDAQVLQQSVGNGWRNIQSRMGLMKGVLDVDSTPGRKGTTLILQLPKSILSTDKVLR